MKTKEFRKRPIKPGKRFWERARWTIKSPERLLVELVTNSVDSYKRLRAVNREASGVVQVSYHATDSGETKIEVKDNAEGISFEKLRIAIEEYGEDTSGLSKGIPVRGTIGVGLKDVGILMKNCRVITVHKGKLNECIIYRENGMPYADYPRVNETISYVERKKLKIEKNGTIVRGILPRDPSFARDFKTLYKHLCRHYMLRKVNRLSKKYRIILKDKRNQKVLRYIPPKGEVLYNEEHYIQYGGVNFLVKITIRKADRRLGQSGNFREGGLIIVYNEDAVADCSLFGFDADSYASRLFGKVEIKVEAFKVAKLFHVKRPIIDEKRRKGLNPDHPFVQRLTSEVQKHLRVIIESEREAKKGLKESVIKSRDALNRVISKFNTMARKELEIPKDITVFPLPPYWTTPELPSFFKFYYDDIGILQHHTTIVGLGILPGIVPDGSPITITSSNPAIRVTPNIIFVDSTKAVRGLIRERVELLGSGLGVKAKITAKHDGQTDEMAVKVIENPILNPEDGFSFIPDKLTIPDGRKKNTDLIIDLALVKKGKSSEVTFTSSNPKIQCPRDMWIFPGLKKKVVGGKVMRLPVSLSGTGVKTRGIVTASLKKRRATLDVEVVRRRRTKGMFSDFKFSKEENLPVISEYDPKTGIITIFKKHPMYKKHEDMGKTLLRVFVTDTIIRTACEAVVREGIRKQSARFPTLSDVSELGVYAGFQYLTNVSLQSEKLYYKHGSSLCELLRHCKFQL